MTGLGRFSGCDRFGESVAADLLAPGASGASAGLRTANKVAP